ncbi:MAG TPA: PAS domain-containing sensor histidine kinase [Cyanobacteria bacterium UBA12227]|nr:PAS domain-containing sensor histidine kinase [Cyanobacteria bacterium UBA12227]HAX86607.1 PAS domain-containing sensor histidine kinase [Cyanobacteria bacterium UBA11370]
MSIISTYSELSHYSTNAQEVQDLLKQSEARFQTLVANIPGAVYRCAYDSAWTMTFLSDAIQDISGYLASEFINNRIRSFKSIIHPQDRANVQESVQQSAIAKQPYAIEYRIVRSEGRIAWVYDKGQAFYNENGEIIGLDGILLDITDRKQTEAELGYTRAFLNSIVENLPVGVVIKDAKELRVMYWNKANEELFGYSREEILGKNDYDFLPKEQARYSRAKDRQVLTGCQLVDIPEAALMTPHRGERIVHTKKVPLLDENGIPRYLLAISEDITERKQSDQALRDSESYYRCIVETASEGVWMFDADNKTTFANSRMAKMLGYTVEEMVGRSLFEFIDPESQGLAQTYTERRCQGIHERYNFKFRRQDGSELWAIVSATPMFDDQGQLVSILRMITDISDVYEELRLRKQTEEALRESERQLRAYNNQLKQTLHQLQTTQTQLIQNEKMASLGQMVAGIAHEINNPVSFIAGNVTYASEYATDLLNLLQLYAKHYPEPALEIQDEIESLELEFVATDFPKLLNSMKEGANRIRQIVLSLRNFSRLDEAEIKEVNIHEGIDSTLLLLQHRLKGESGNSEIQIFKDYGKLPLVECYAGQLNQVFINLLNNAIEALESQPEPRVIRIHTSVKNGKESSSTPSIIIRISDNGCGIPENIQKLIFDPFFTTKPIGTATGLGLSISHSIVVDKHGGKLTCNSTPSQGAEFVIELPVRQS